MEVLKELEILIHRGHSSHQVFSDWLELMITALDGNREEDYLSVVSRYKDEREMGDRNIDHFQKAFAELLKEYRKEQKDVLGELYMNWNISNKYTGQFFTPWQIAECMAKMTRPNGRIGDPSCGSGVMLIAGAKEADCDKSIFIGQDLDYTCVRMCALNLCFFNLNGYAVHGNTLTEEVQTVFQTTRSLLGGSIRKLNDKETEEFKNNLYPNMKLGQQSFIEI
jgi:hypothetical protein